MNAIQPGTQVPVRDPFSERPLGSWTVQGLLARGGQGVVYTVEAPRGRLGVLKVPSSQGLISMEVERRILLKLPPHKNVVRVLGLTTLQGVDCPIFAHAYPNPYVKLGTKAVRAELARHAWGKQQRLGLPATTAVEMIQELCAALEHLHRHGFVHGDIKPANVLVEIDANRVRLPNRDYFDAIQRRAYNTVLVDFGSTRGTAFLEDHDEEDVKIVPSEFTPLYAPPEAFLEGSRLGTSVDVYQIGLLLYQLLTGRFPYEQHLDDPRRLRELSAELIELKRAEAQGELSGWDRETLLGASLDDVFFAESYQSQRLRDRFCQDVLELVTQAAAPDPAQRPTMAAFRAELLRLFQLEPPQRGVKGRSCVSVWNPRWHLRRTNRLARAALALEPEELEPTPPPAGGDSGMIEHVRAALTADPDGDTRSFQDTRTDLAQKRPAPGERREPRPAPGRPPSGRAPVARGEPPQGPLVGARVALVDDDKVALAVLGSALRKRGCRVGTFRDPESALEVVARDHPDALIVDMQMPGLSGPGLVTRLADRLNGLPFPVLVLSSLEREQALQDAFRAGASDYLVKPCSEAELAVKLEQALTRMRERVVPEVPLELGGFEVGAEVCRGELATVYEAHDPWGEEGTRYSVKVLRPELVGEGAPLLGLRREVDVLSGVDHPALPRLIKSGLVGGLVYYVTGEWPTRTLGQEVREAGTLSPEEVVLLLQDLGGALAHLHQKNLLLGELTPESLGRLSSGRHLLTELSQARHLGPALREDEPPLTRSRYAPPELFGEAQLPDLPSDVYALGACALELYSGKPAVRSRSSQRVDVGTLGAGLPDVLIGILEGMLEPRASARLHSDALLAELGRLGG